MCGGARPDVDLTSTIDHDTNDTDPQSTAGTLEEAGKCEYAMPRQAASDHLRYAARTQNGALTFHPLLRKYEAPGS